MGSSEYLLEFGVIILLSCDFCLEWRLSKQANTNGTARAFNYVGVSFPYFYYYYFECGWAFLFLIFLFSFFLLTSPISSMVFNFLNNISII